MLRMKSFRFYEFIRYCMKIDMDEMTLISIEVTKNFK
jgi:hypothetical protein